MDFKQTFEDKSLEAYINGGAGDETALLENEKIFDDLRLTPRILADVSHCSTAVFDTALGAGGMPIVIAPTAFHKLVSCEGECDTARIAAEHNIPYIVSSFSSCSIDKICDLLPSNYYCQQLYVFQNQEIIDNIISDAEIYNARAIVITVGTPIAGDRRRERNAGWQVPSGISSRFSTSGSNTISELAAATLSTSATWKSIQKIKDLTSIPIIVKGVLDPDDAVRAFECGCSAVVISNHGGRQLGHSIHALDVLSIIRERIGSSLPLYVDGGIRTGLDVVKVLACGADRVLLGRPVLWKLNEGGITALSAYMMSVKEEILHVMQLCGCDSIEQLKSLKVVRRL